MKTAVEWLIDEMNNIKGSSTNMNSKVQFLEKELNNLFEQAKEMEKEEIENAFNYGQFDLGMEADDYYNETFKSE
tara:strand:- start:184 stop:408 length:225 start_codon:yes stop_codon:yes gene_type:complete